MEIMRKFLYITILAFVFQSCGQPTDEERAQTFLDVAQNFYELKNVEAAKIQ